MNSLSLRQLYQEAQTQPLPDGVEAGLSPASLKPSSLKFLREYVRREKPKAVLEFGSGFSTRWLMEAAESAGYQLEVYSVENSAFYCERTRESLAGRASAHLIHAPLASYFFRGRFFYTYSSRYLDQIPADLEFDLVLIDGPLGFFHREAQLYQIRDHLRDGTCVILDDSHRGNEQFAISNWRKVWPKMEVLEFGQAEPFSIFLFNGEGMRHAPWGAGQILRSVPHVVRRFFYNWSGKLTENSEHL